MRVAAVQLCSTPDRSANLAAAEDGIADAVRRGAELVVLPEMFDLLGSGRTLREGALPLAGLTGTWSATQARAHGIWLVAGSTIERLPDGSRRNTTAVYGPDGARLTTYSKLHLFDVDVPGAAYHESAITEPGDRAVVVDVAGTRLGLSICFDVRFPELYRALALDGARIVAVPSAFTATTGPPHWEVLLRARAIEEQVFVIAAGQCGASTDRLRWHGHSMIIDPWGTVLAEAGATPEVLVADVDLAHADHVRRVLPVLDLRRTDVLGPSAGSPAPADAGGP